MYTIHICIYVYMCVCIYIYIYIYIDIVYCPHCGSACFPQIRCVQGNTRTALIRTGSKFGGHGSRGCKQRGS